MVVDTLASCDAKLILACMLCVIHVREDDGSNV